MGQTGGEFAHGRIFIYLLPLYLEFLQLQFFFFLQLQNLTTSILDKKKHTIS